MSGMNRCITPAAEPNYWLRRVATEVEAPATTAPSRTRADIIEDVLYALALTVLWVAASIVIAWKTIPGGIEALPTFLILFGMYTTCVIMAWIRGR